MGAFLSVAAANAEPNIPNFWDTKEQISTPKPGFLTGLTFLTTIDFPPFNFIDNNGRLAGFHVDMGHAICDRLGLQGSCKIQALPWEELESAVLGGTGDAILAGISPSAKLRDDLQFSRSYLRFPARFVAADDTNWSEPLASHIAAKRIGVLSGSAHQAMLRDYFPDVRQITYSRTDWMYADLKDGKIDGVFADGMQLSFWIGSAVSGACCKFVGGPYVSDRYFGQGLSIAIPKDNKPLHDALNYALREIQSDGVFAELYLRYFPVSFY